MKTTPSVKEVMIPVGEYAVVSESATLREAILALEDAQRRLPAARFQLQALLVVDETGNVVGKLSQMDIVHCLDPHLGVGQRVGRLRHRLAAISNIGFSQEFVDQVVEAYRLEPLPFDVLCTRAASIKVKDVMYTPGRSDMIDADVSLDLAVQQMARGHYHSLLVRRGGDIVGILRLTDVFERVSAVLKTCPL
jgi:CBS domain-containing protein